jgi:glutamyl-tRNA synthetase
MPDEGETVFDDHLRGQVRFQNALLDDFVILKSDGFPTYHLAMPVDDHAMEITHVIRGEEWLASAPRHKLLFEALGYEMPTILHVSLILGKDRAKLSKRHGAQSVLEYRAAGYLPEAVLNFLALLGWSLDDKTEIISREELVANFSIDRLIPSPAVFDIDKLNWMNGEYMRSMPVERLTSLLIEWLERPYEEGGLPDAVARPVDFEYAQRIVPLVRERVKLLPEARDMMAFFFLAGDLEVERRDLLGKRFADDAEKAQIGLSAALVAAERVANSGDWSHDALEAAFRAVAEDEGLKAGDLFMLMRVALTGRTVSPPLFETMEILGPERSIRRLRVASQTA